MRTLLALATCFFLGWSASSRASQAQADPAVQPGPLAPLAPFVGKEWVSTFPNGALTDTQRFEWLYGQKFVRNPHQVKDAAGEVVYEGETIYGWDAAASELRWWYFNATGGWIDGTVAVEDDGTLVFEGVNHGGPGQTAKVRSTAHFEGADRYVSTTWFWRDGEWQVERELEFAPAP